MDEKLKYSTEQIEKMLASLEDASTEYEKRLEHAELNDYETHRQCDFLRDSVIQRFEYSVEGFWKYLKTYLEIKIGLAQQELGPKPTIRTAVLHRVITEDQAVALLEMIDQRNRTSHIYKEEIVDRVALYTPEAVTLMRNIVNKLKKQ